MLIGRSLICFIVVVGNHYLTVFFLWNFSTYNAHMSIIAAEIATLKHFLRATSFDPDSRLALLLYNLISEDI